MIEDINDNYVRLFYNIMKIRYIKDWHKLSLKIKVKYLLEF